MKYECIDGVWVVVFNYIYGYGINRETDLFVFDSDEKALMFVNLEYKHCIEMLNEKMNTSLSYAIHNKIINYPRFSIITENNDSYTWEIRQRNVNDINGLASKIITY